MTNTPESPRPIAEINTHIRNTLEREIRIKHVTVIGKVIGRVYISDMGHVYFKISENDYAIPCFLRQTVAKTLDFKIQLGMQLEVSGFIRVYDKDLEVQIEIEKVAILQRPPSRNLDELEAQLKSAGHWRTTKHPLPPQINRIGLVTSSSSRARDDFESFYAEQGGKAHIWHERVRIEGEQASQEIVSALQSLNRRADIDVIVLTRGGGRPEELAVFSDPKIAQAIGQSTKPVITGIGHESDETLADRAADVKAITPTAAAVLLAHHQSLPTPVINSFLSCFGISAVISLLVILGLLLFLAVK